MVNEEMCIGPLQCRTRTGECCNLELFEGSVVCPLSCNINRQSENQGGYSLTEIFKTTFVTTLLFDVLSKVGAITTTLLTTSTTTTTTETTTTAPTFTSSLLNSLVFYSGFNFKHILVDGASGTFISINYPSNYSQNYEEQYSISVEDGSRITLNFEHYDIEYHVSCIYDYIEGDT